MCAGRSARELSHHSLGTNLEQVGSWKIAFEKVKFKKDHNISRTSKLLEKIHNHTCMTSCAIFLNIRKHKRQNIQKYQKT